MARQGPTGSHRGCRVLQSTAESCGVLQGLKGFFFQGPGGYYRVLQGVIEALEFYWGLGGVTGSYEVLLGPTRPTVKW